jgi:TolB-like protein
MTTSSPRSAPPRAIRRALLLALPLAFAACSTVSVPPAPALDRNAPWALLPMVNHTETPQAGLRAEAILESLLRGGGIASLRRYPSSIGGDALFEPSERKGVDRALDWARSQGARYAVTGTVDEWRYKVGVDGEPAVGFTLQVLDVQSGKVLWSAAGGRTGWSREALSAVAHQLLTRLSAPLLAAAR